MPTGTHRDTPALPGHPKVMQRGRRAVISSLCGIGVVALSVPALQAPALAVNRCEDTWRFNGEYRATSVRYAPQEYLNCSIARQVAGKVGRMSELEVRGGKAIRTRPGGAMFSCRLPKRTYAKVYFDGNPYTSIKVLCRWWEWGGEPVIRFTKHSRIWD